MIVPQLRHVFRMIFLIRVAKMTLDVGEEMYASHSRSIVPLRGGKQFSQDIAHFVVGMPDRKLSSVNFHSYKIITRIKK